MVQEQVKMAENILIHMSILNIKWELSIFLLVDWIFLPIRK